MRKVIDDRAKWVRLLELADRLTAPGEKAAHVSASETHEIRDGIHKLVDIVCTRAVLRRPCCGTFEKAHREGSIHRASGAWFLSGYGGAPLERCPYCGAPRSEKAHAGG